MQKFADACMFCGETQGNMNYSTTLESYFHMTCAKKILVENPSDLDLLSLKYEFTNELK